MMSYFICGLIFVFGSTFDPELISPRALKMRGICMHFGPRLKVEEYIVN